MDKLFSYVFLFFSMFFKLCVVLFIHFYDLSFNYVFMSLKLSGVYFLCLYVIL